MTIISLCERQFISNCVIKKQKRLDGRQLLQGRTLEIVFGKERGCVMVLLGNTRMLAQVSGEITEPKTLTPTEGTLHINFELSAMASPDAKTLLRSSEEIVEIQRSLERCIRDSKVVEQESLCIITGSKVWTIRLDIHTLNDDGNIIEAASIAAISALAHYRRPEVTVVGTDVTIHSFDEKEPVALNLHHMPVCINLALFEQGKYILVDPIETEEKICDGCYIIGMNAHQEICYVHRRGVLLLSEDVVQRCQDVAVKRAQELTQLIREALDDDAYKRATNAPVGFTNLIIAGTILCAKRPMAEIDLDSINSLQETIEPDISLPDDNNSSKKSNNKKIGDLVPKTSAAKLRAKSLLSRAGIVFEGGPSKWGEEMDDDDDDEGEEEEDEDEEEDSEIVHANVKPEPPAKEEISLDSEEEETVYLHNDQLDVKTPSRGWYSRDPFE